jgi:AraC-like DNA-binding protein
LGAQRDPVREWRELYARRCLRIDFEPLSDAPFCASVQPIFEDLHVVRSRLSAGRSFRDEELVKDGDDALSLLIALSKDICINHQAREQRLGFGDATLLHVCATGSVASRRDFEFIPILVPYLELTERGVRLDDAVMRFMPRRSDSLQLLRSYVLTLEKSRLGARSGLREPIRQHIIDLVALAATAHSGIGESGLSAVAAARLAAALDCIAARIEDPGLTIAAVARSQGVSRRYLQRLIEATGTTFTEHVNELRLQRAFSLLTEAGEEAVRISDVALRAGFSDVSHFNRLFRSRFGDTPSAVRGRHRSE